MKILIDGRLYGLENAGLGRYLINLIDQLGKIDSKNDYVLLLRKKYYDGLNLPSNWKKVLADFRHYSLAEQIKLPALIEREKPDIVHFPHFNVPLLYRGRFVVTIHDMLMHKESGLKATTLPALSYYLKRMGYRFVFDNSVKASRKIIVPSQAVKVEVIESYKIPKNKIAVTYEGAAVIDSDVKIDLGGTPYYIYAGNAYPHKNLERLVKAMVLLNNKYAHPVKLLIASSRGIFTRRLIRMIKNQKAVKYVKLLGFVPDEELFGLYKNSIGFIFPSLSEGFGLPGIEAMATGTMVLASDIPIFREIYKDNVIYFDPLDIKSIESAMENVLIMDPVLKASRIKRASDFVKKYSWAKMADQTIKIYAESCNSIRPGK